MDRESPAHKRFCVGSSDWIDSNPLLCDKTATTTDADGPVLLDERDGRHTLARILELASKHKETIQEILPSTVHVGDVVLVVLVGNLFDEDETFLVRCSRRSLQAHLDDIVSLSRCEGSMAARLYAAHNCLGALRHVWLLLQDSWKRCDTTYCRDMVTCLAALSEHLQPVLLACTPLPLDLVSLVLDAAGLKHQSITHRLCAFRKRKDLL